MRFIIGVMIVLIKLLIFCSIIGISLYKFKLFFIKNKSKLPFYNIIEEYVVKNKIIYNAILLILVIVLIILLEIVNISRVYIASTAVLVWCILIDGSIIIKTEKSKHNDIMETCITIIIAFIEYICFKMGLIDALYIIALNVVLCKSIRIQYIYIK